MRWDQLYETLCAWFKGGRKEERAPSHAQAEETVTEASEESFPASDPPSYTPVAGVGRPDDRKG